MEKTMNGKQFRVVGKNAESRYFSGGLYFENVRRLKLTGFIFLALFVLLGILIPTARISDAAEAMNYADSIFPITVLSGGEIMMLLLLVPYAMVPIMTLTAFGFLNRRAASDFYHSLPHSRTSLLLTNAAAVMSWALFDCLVGTLLPVVLYALFPQYFSVNLISVLLCFLSIIVTSFAVLAGITLGMSITGTYLNNCIVAGMILFLPRILFTVIFTAISDCPILTSDSFPFFYGVGYNLVVGLPVQLLTGYSGDLFGSVPAIVYTFLLGLIYLSAAHFFFCRRGSESAEHSSPSRRLQAVYRISLTTLFCSVICLMICEDSLDIFALILYGIAVIIYFAYDLVTTRSFRGIVKTIPGLLIVAGLNILMLGAMTFGDDFALNYQPEPEQISSVMLTDFGRGTIYVPYRYSSMGEQDMYFSRKVSTIRIEDDEIAKLVSDVLKDNVRACRSRGGFYTYYEDRYQKGEMNPVMVKIRPAFGFARTRRLYLSNAEIERLNDVLKMNEEFLGVMTGLPEPIPNSMYISLNSSLDYLNQWDISGQYAEIFDCYKAEFESLDPDDCLELIARSTSGEVANLLYSAYAGLGSSVVGLPVTFEYTPKTAVMILDILAEKSGVGEEEYKNLLDSVESGMEGKYTHLEGYFIDYDGNGRYLSSVYFYTTGSDEDGETLFDSNQIAADREIYYAVEEDVAWDKEIPDSSREKAISELFSEILSSAAPGVPSNGQDYIVIHGYRTVDGPDYFGNIDSFICTLSKDFKLSE